MTIAATSQIEVTVQEAEISSEKGKTLYTRAVGTFIGQDVFIDAYGQTAQDLLDAQGVEVEMDVEIINGTPTQANKYFYFRAKRIYLPQTTVSVDTEVALANEQRIVKALEVLDRLQTKPSKFSKKQITEALEAALHD